MKWFAIGFYLFYFTLCTVYRTAESNNNWWKTFFNIPKNVMNSLQTHTNHCVDSWKLIFPGTLWCGSGNISNENLDLGKYTEVDACCRAHDLCNDSIPAGKMKNGLTNKGHYAKSHCCCDIDFYNCLKNCKSKLAKKIGFAYFTLLGPDCYKLDYKHIKCQNKHFGRCLEYEVDKTTKPTYQWCNNPYY